ncbi:MAG: 50S ribosomal protein L6 [Rhizobiales bacterium]|nr:50S ribosomal protein L6 [Hyphomicrobiales bacterium]
MSRIGKKPVVVPSGVEVKIDGQTVKAKGSKGELSVTLVDDVTVEITDDGVVVSPVGESKRARSMWGMSRTLVQNIFVGVSEGYKKELEINGVGYRAAMKGKSLSLQLGLSHDVNYDLPEGIKIECPSQTEIVVSGIEKQVVGQVAAEIRSYRPPEPYKGKGIKYKDEYIFRKEGKKK